MTATDLFYASIRHPVSTEVRLGALDSVRERADAERSRCITNVGISTETEDFLTADRKRVAYSHIEWNWQATVEATDGIAAGALLQDYVIDVLTHAGQLAEPSRFRAVTSPIESRFEISLTCAEGGQAPVLAQQFEERLVNVARATRLSVRRERGVIQVDFYVPSIDVPTTGNDWEKSHVQAMVDDLMSATGVSWIHYSRNGARFTGELYAPWLETEAARAVGFNWDLVRTGS